MAQFRTPMKRAIAASTGGKIISKTINTAPKVNNKVTIHPRLFRLTSILLKATELLRGWQHNHEVLKKFIESISTTTFFNQMSPRKAFQSRIYFRRELIYHPDGPNPWGSTDFSAKDAQQVCMYYSCCAVNACHPTPVND